MSASPTPLIVNLPDGEQATYKEMQIYGRMLQTYIRRQEDALPLVNDASRHNQIVEYLVLLADAYNEQLGHYKASEIRRQQALVLAMMGIHGR
ncbi:MAG: hypothetical protein ACR2PS_12000 [Pseudomonadales bacterium]